MCCGKLQSHFGVKWFLISCGSFIRDDLKLYYYVTVISFKYHRDVLVFWLLLTSSEHTFHFDLSARQKLGVCNDIHVAR